MFQYSRVVRYKVSVPAQKLEFSSSINTDWLQNEIESVGFWSYLHHLRKVAKWSLQYKWITLSFNCCLQVYTKGLLLFTEISKYLKEIKSGFSGSNHLRNGSSEGFSDIVALLKLERSEFEVSLSFSLCVYPLLLTGFCSMLSALNVVIYIFSEELFTALVAIYYHALMSSI